MAMLKSKVIIKLSKSFLGRVRPQTKADSELQLKLQRQAHTCGNALLAAELFNLGPPLLPFPQDTFQLFCL